MTGVKFELAPAGFLILATILLTMDHAMADNIERTNAEKATYSESLDGQWRFFSDQVMGGISNGRMDRDSVSGRDCLRLQGSVSTDNNGGFIQVALDLSDTRLPDPSNYDGISLWVSGNDQEYNLHLRTADLWFPWQSYRSTFNTSPTWQRIRLPFDLFKGYKTRQALDLKRIERIGLVAIGRDFQADLCFGDIRFYRR